MAQSRCSTRGLRRALAEKGPVAVSERTIQKIERNTTLPDNVRAGLKPLVLEPIAGRPKWHLVPTGPLAGGDMAFGTLVRSDPDDDALISGCTMSQEKSVRGEKVASSYRWQIRDVDLSERARRKRLARHSRGKYYLAASYA